jgi:hypothetical protein
MVLLFSTRSSLMSFLTFPTDDFIADNILKSQDVASVLMPRRFRHQDIQDFRLLDVDIRKFESPKNERDVAQSPVFHLTFLFSDHSLWRAGYAYGMEVDDPDELIDARDEHSYVPPLKKPVSESFIVADDVHEHEGLASNPFQEPIIHYGRDRFVEDRVRRNEKIINRPFFNMHKAYQQLIDLKLPVSSIWYPAWDTADALDFQAVQTRLKAAQRDSGDPSATA